jgi:hypothetical protein
VSIGVARRSGRGREGGDGWGGGGDMCDEEEGVEAGQEKGASIYAPPHLYQGIAAPIQMSSFVPSLISPWYKCAFRFVP